MTSLLLKNTRIIDPLHKKDFMGEVYIRKGVIKEVAPAIKHKLPEKTQIIDCNRFTLLPGIFDMQVFLAEPGNEHLETIKTLGRAAAKGGVTSVLTMPNTNPTIDDVSMVDFIKLRSKSKTNINIYPMAALTHNLEGKKMAEIGLLKRAGALAFSDSMKNVSNPSILRNIMVYAKNYDALIIQQVYDKDLSGSGVMNEGELSTKLGLPGISKYSEIIALERDLRLVELTGTKYHAAQISCLESMNIIRQAKKKGLPVTCGVSINHLMLSEKEVGTYRTFFKLNPPLRTERDRRALARGVRDGIIDVIVSNHTPQSSDTKRHPFEDASYGAIGVETLLPAAMEVSRKSKIDINLILKSLTHNPAKILGLDKVGTIKEGCNADLTLVDFERPHKITSKALVSKCKNTPYEDKIFQTQILLTISKGKIAYQSESKTKNLLNEYVFH